MESLSAHRDLHARVTRLGIKLLLAFTFFFQIIGGLSAQPSPALTNARELVPGSLLYFPPDDPGYILLVEKITQRAYLYRTCNIDDPVKVYPCSTGENSGPKSRMNDKKTPEGVYFVTNSFERKDLAPIYGDMAFPIDYPNVRDRKLGKQGYGIWIHGTNEPLKPRDTNGCIVFSNEDIGELSRYISENETPVVITQRINFVAKQELLRKRAQIKAFIDNWLEAWRSGQIDLYISLYAEDFTGQGRNRPLWRNYKRRLGEFYGPVGITIENLRIVEENGIALAKFDQSYRADRFKSFGEKRLYLQQKSPEWKIIDEFFKRKARTPLRAQRDEDREAVNKLLITWQQAWQDEDLEGYMACYSEDFSSRGLNRRQWEQHKSRLNERYANIQITLGDLNIEFRPPTEALVSFDQDYRSDQYHDWGRKTMCLKKQDGIWKIRREIWLPAEERSKN
jgi:murein L,D-transpeptidase YafK